MGLGLALSITYGGGGEGFLGYHNGTAQWWATSLSQRELGCIVFTSICGNCLCGFVNEIVVTLASLHIWYCET